MRSVAVSGGLERFNSPSQGSNNGSPHTSQTYRRPSLPEEGLRQQARDAEPVKTGTARGRKGSGYALLEAKLQHHIEHEDRRVKELTEAILYDFLPSAMDVMLPATADPASELHMDRCRAVAGAALCIGSLMNAPPGFLEFLLCVPWANLQDLFPRDGNWNDEDTPSPTLCLDEEERRLLVNQRLHPLLVDLLLQFMYRPEHVDSVPPTLRLAASSSGLYSKQEGLKSTKGKGPRRVTYDAVAALLDGATPLHCAAIRGNPAQVDHLLYCGADPLAKTGAGELPLEMVLLCGSCFKTSGGSQGWACRCMPSRDAEVWECRSRLARSLIARRCVLHFSAGLFSWLHLIFLSLLCMLGLWGCPTSIDRPLTEKHEQKIAGGKRKSAIDGARSELKNLREASAQGCSHLNRAAEGEMGSHLLRNPLEPVPPDRPWYSVWGDPPDEAGRGRHASGLYHSKANVPFLAGIPNGHPDHVIRITSEGSEESKESLDEEICGDELRRFEAEQAAACYGRAVQILQRLSIRPGGMPGALLDAGVSVTSHLWEFDPPDNHDQQCWWQLDDVEQADIYCGWAESVLLKHRTCGCRGCQAHATQAIAAAHVLCSQLFAQAEKSRSRYPARWRDVGLDLAKIVHAHACLLLDTHAHLSPQRSVLWQAQLCLREWNSMRDLSLLNGDTFLNSRAIDLLEMWSKMAESDLILAEALAGQALGPSQPIGEVVPPLILMSHSHGFFLSQSVTKETGPRLEEALDAAPYATKHMKDIVRGCAANARCEIAAADALREVVNTKGGMSGLGTALEQLTAAINAAAIYPSLQLEVQEARTLKERWERRAEAVARLDAVMEAVRQNPDNVSPSCSSFWEEWACRISRLEQAIDDAREANISVNRAKRLVKDMQAQAAAADAATRLEEVLQHKPCGSGVLKAALAKAEAAATAAAASGTRLAEGAELLVPALAAARRQLEMERAAETLSRVAASATKLTDLPRVEAAILAARKVGAQDLDPEVYRTASDLRANLEGAAKARTSLESAIRALGRGGRTEDEEMVQAAINEAVVVGGHLLEEDIERAKEVLQRWRGAAASEAKLARALKEGANTAYLSRAIQEAAAAGVKVADAKRILKLMQALEAVMASAVDGPGQAAGLRAKVEAAEQGGVTSPLLAEAQLRLTRIMCSEAKNALESALKPRFTSSSVDKTAALSAALEQADSLLQSGLPGTSGMGLKDGQAEPEEGCNSTSGSDHHSILASSSMGAPADSALIEEDLGAVKRLVVEARKLLAAEAAEQERIEQERAEEQRAKRERQRAERAEREREKQERTEREKAEREKAEKERMERRERERQEKSRLAREQAALAERKRRERGGGDRSNNHRGEHNRSRRAIPIVPTSSGGSVPGKCARSSSPTHAPASQAPFVASLPSRLDPVVSSPFQGQLTASEELHPSTTVVQPLQRSASLGGLSSSCTGLVSKPLQDIKNAGLDGVKLVTESGTKAPLLDTQPSSIVNVGELMVSDPKVTWPPTPLFGQILPAGSASPATMPIQDRVNSSVPLEASKTPDRGVMDCRDNTNNAMANFPSGILARLAPFLTGWGTTSGGVPPRAASPEASVGSGSLSVERSTNSVSSDGATPRPKYADLGGASWCGVPVREWSTPASGAASDPAPLPTSLWPQSASNHGLSIPQAPVEPTPKDKEAIQLQKPPQGLTCQAPILASGQKAAPLSDLPPSRYSQNTDSGAFPVHSGHPSPLPFSSSQLPYTSLNASQAHLSKEAQHQDQSYGATPLPLAAALNDSTFLSRVGSFAALVNQQSNPTQLPLGEVMRQQRASADPSFYDMPKPSSGNHHVFSCAQQGTVGEGARQQRTSIDTSYYGMAKSTVQPVQKAYPSAVPGSGTEFYPQQYGGSLYRNSTGTPVSAASSSFKPSSATVPPSLFASMSEVSSPSDLLQHSSVNISPVMPAMGIRLDSQITGTGTAVQGGLLHGSTLQSGLTSRPSGQSGFVPASTHQPGFGSVTRTVSLPSQSVIDPHAYLPRTGPSGVGIDGDPQLGLENGAPGLLQRAPYGSGGMCVPGAYHYGTAGYRGLPPASLNRQASATGEGRGLAGARRQEAGSGKYATHVPLPTSWDISWQRLKGRE
eukprot:jgi/Botrbrau1/7200/Bobra.0300s0026.1